MDKAVKKELDKMLLLMERMDKRYTLDEAQMLEDRIEHTRETYTDLDQFLNDVNLGNSFVGLGYIQGYEARKVYPTNPTVNVANGLTQADSIRSEFSKIDKNSRVWGKMNNMINDPEFSSPSGRAYAGYRSFNNLPFAGIVKITSYVFNWGDKSDLADFYRKYHKDVEAARLAAGFGKNDTDYAANDWHRNEKYKGLGASPESSGKNFRNSYLKKIDPTNSLYGETEADGSDRLSTRKDGSQYQRRAFRFALKDMKKQWSKYCLVDANGEIDDVESSLGKLLGKAASEHVDLRKTIIPQMSQDEKDFINAISKLEDNRAYSDKTWLTDNIAYIVAGEYDPRTKTRRYVRYINPDVQIDKIDVNPAELKPIVDREIAGTEKVVRYEKEPEYKAAAEE